MILFGPNIAPVVIWDDNDEFSRRNGRRTNKGFDFHHAILTQKGSITEEKIAEIIIDLKIDTDKIQEDLKKEEIDNALHITSFIASAIGARGTPAVFINNEFNPGYVPKDIIEKILR